METRTRAAILTDIEALEQKIGELNETFAQPTPPTMRAKPTLDTLLQTLEHLQMELAGAPAEEETSD